MHFPVVLVLSSTSVHKVNTLRQLPVGHRVSTLTFNGFWETQPCVQEATLHRRVRSQKDKSLFFHFLVTLLL